MKRFPVFVVLTVALLVFLAPSPVYPMMHPAQGRFLQRDPAGYVDGGSLYERERGSPLAQTDPDGMRSQVMCCPLAIGVENVVPTLIYMQTHNVYGMIFHYGIPKKVRVWVYGDPENCEYSRDASGSTVVVRRVIRGTAEPPRTTPGGKDDGPVDNAKRSQFALPISKMTIVDAPGAYQNGHPGTTVTVTGKHVLTVKSTWGHSIKKEYDVSGTVTMTREVYDSRAGYRGPDRNTADELREAIFGPRNTW